MNKKQKSLNNKGFSLVELIIVIAIMAVLIGVLAPQYLKYVKNSKISSDIANAQEIATAINVAIADGKIAVPSSETTFNNSTDLANVENLTALPASKLNASSAWVIKYDANGVTSITLGGTNIYPDASDYEDL